MSLGHDFYTLSSSSGESLAGSIGPPYKKCSWAEGPNQLVAHAKAQLGKQLIVLGIINWRLLQVPCNIFPNI